MQGPIRRRHTPIVLAAMLLATVVTACSSGSPGSSASASGGTGAAPRPVTLPHSEVRTLTSSSTGRTYDLYLGYPEGYAPGGPVRYPVLYLLDAQWDFKLVQAIYDDQTYDGPVPKLIIVGITYSGKDPDYGALRAHDFTPVASPEEPTSGGGPAFQKFLRTELMPYVEKNLPADPKRRVLVGSSYGGLFALYSMFTEPDLFSAYVSSSPAVTFGSGEILRVEEAYAAKRRDLPTRLWIAVGSAERFSAPVQAFWQTLRGRSYTGLELQTRLLDGEGHAGSKPEAYSRGLRYIFAGHNGP